MPYTVVLIAEPDDSTITVRVPSMPGVFTWAPTKDEALAAAREAIEAYLPQYLERGETLPPDQATWADLVTTLPRPRNIEIHTIDVAAPASRVAS